MTVASEVNRSGPYIGNGVTTVFPYGFRILNAAHLTVIREQAGVETALTLGAGYTVSDVGDAGGGSITLAAAPSAAQTITILRNAPFTQETELENQGPYFAKTIEAAFDLAAMRDQQLSERVDRALAIPASADPSALSSMIDDVLRLADSANNIDLVAGSIANVAVVAGVADDVRKVAAVADELESALFIQEGVGAVTRTMQDKARERVSAADFRAVIDIDDTNAIQRAIDSLAVKGGIVDLPAGNLTISAKITIARPGITIRGAGREATIITSSSASHSLQINSGFRGTTLLGFKLTRTTVAGVGQNGVHCVGLCEVLRFDDVYVENHYIGYRFGTTSYSYIHNCIASDNYNDGFYFTNEDGIGTGCQYTLSKLLSQQNDGFGYSFRAVTASMSVGDWLNLTTYANKLGGFNLQGAPTYGVNAIRWVGGIVGEDGKHGALFNTYNGSTHRIAGVTFEIAGTSLCGRHLSSPVTHQGNGANVTINNGYIKFTDCVFIGNSWSGTYAAGTKTQFVGCQWRVNGHANLNGEENGLYADGPVEVVGCVADGNPAFGLFLGVDGHTIIGNDLTGNIDGIGFAVPQIASKIALNRGTGVNVNHNPGTPTNDNATAGNVGEYIESVVASGSAAALTSGVVGNLTFLDLAPGDWEVGAVFQFSGGATTDLSSIAGSISLTSAVHDFSSGRGLAAAYAGIKPFNQIAAGQPISLPVAQVRISLAVATRVYAVRSSIFSTSNCSAFGMIRARRVR